MTLESADTYDAVGLIESLTVNVECSRLSLKLGAVRLEVVACAVRVFPGLICLSHLSHCQDGSQEQVSCV